MPNRNDYETQQTPHALVRDCAQGESMSEAILTYLGNGMCRIVDDGDRLSKMKIGSVLRITWTLLRSAQFHRKYFALLDTAFDWWEPREVTYKGVIVAKDKEKFRKDVQIMAGFGYPVVNIRGEVRMESESISFARMNQERFDKLYDAVLNVILDKVLSRKDEQRLAEAVEAVMSFT